MKRLIFIFLIMTGCYTDFYESMGKGTANKLNEICVDDSEKTKDNVDYICIDGEWVIK